jgi:hypothetical protein
MSFEQAADVLAVRGDCLSAEDHAGAEGKHALDNFVARNATPKGPVRTGRLVDFAKRRAGNKVGN